MTAIRRTAVRATFRSTVRTALTAASGLALALAFAAPASAHAGLVGTDPEDGAALDTAPAAVTATFSENLDGPSTEIAVTGPDGAVIEAGDPVFEGDTFTQPMLYGEPGEYTVAYRVISEDGHRIDGAVSFTVSEVPDELSLNPVETETSAAETTAASEPAETGSTSEAAAEEDSGNNAAVIAGALLVLLAVAIGVAVLVNRRRKSAA
ncbi:copper resistance CopC family protein [Glycomyces mayteni]|uniref:Copper resistance CopC family protein n=1 Tax=Glycomyces mayteni TaxID=543887 RepID=A0ABW2D7E7_9ACTN|nr:copper resistance protein CopC [Glycomyces mayteni]